MIQQQLNFLIQKQISSEEQTQCFGYKSQILYFKYKLKEKLFNNI